MLQVVERNDAVDAARLGHAEAVNAQDLIEQVAGVQIARIAVGIQGNAAFDGRIEDVVDMQVAARADRSPR